MGPFELYIVLQQIMTKVKSKRNNQNLVEITKINLKIYLQNPFCFGLNVFKVYCIVINYIQSQSTETYFD